MAAKKGTTKKLTRFEKARVLGARAIQLSMGAKPMEHKEIDKFIKNADSLDPIDIATKELELGILPLDVRPKE
ncbi:DNA-directed RNA polymerase subunit K [uncultured Methanobrevibacter sp.]|uniref:DNA-directed RNA polymerase subunit K n=1 Tax=uncultured Methanobrevibacter sp. TaxID=253161 RepID=UPI002632C5FA